MSSPFRDSITPPTMPVLPPSGFHAQRHVNPGDPGNDYPEEHLFRPHAFALTHGDGGAKIAYGELLWYVTHQTAVLGSGGIDSIAQDAIDSPNQTVPTLESAVGTLMDSKTPNVYHQLSGYGEIWLQWNYEKSSRNVTECFVVVGEPTVTGIPALTAALTRTHGTAGR